MEIKGKVAIVTGASSGIGKATAQLLAKKGAKVTLAARSKDKLETVAAQIPDAFVVVTDMTKILDVENMVQATVEHFGRVDVLVNCAGQGYDAPVEQTDVDILHYIFELDLVGPLIAMQQVIPHMRLQGGGAIVNVSSGTALMTLPNNGAYSAVKRALANLSLTANEELKGDRIAVSVIYPYMTDTDFEKNTIKAPSLKGESEEANGEPLRLPDSAEYVAQKIVEGIESGAAEIYAHDWMKNITQR